MVTLVALWLPIVSSAVAVFVLSSLVHMVFKWHNADYHGFGNEDEVRAAIQRGAPPAGQYMIPYCIDPQQMRAPEMQQKFRDGPVAFVLLRERGVMNMGRSLGLWFVYAAVVALFAGYLASRSLPSGAAFAAVFRLVATVTFMTFVGGSVQNAIWMGKPWNSVAKELLDGAIYGAATGAVFGALWPH